MSSEFSFDSKVVADALKNIYEKKFNPMTDIESRLFFEFWDKLNAASDTGIAQSTASRSGDFHDALRHNNGVFAAFKTHRMQNDVAALLLDSNGVRRSFKEWVELAKPIASHQVDSWFKTEYTTAIDRARLAADWKRFERNADILPNLEWLPSTSATPRKIHEPFYGLILPIKHPFWSKHKPHELWGCKCDLAATDAPRTPEDQIPWEDDVKPVEGMENNPADDGKLFNDTHPYFPSSCGSCKLKGTISPSNWARTLFFGQKKKDCYTCGKTNEIVKKAKGKVLTKLDHEIIAQFTDKRIDVSSSKLTTGRLLLTEEIVESYLYHTYNDRMKRVILDLSKRLNELKWNNDFKKLQKEGKSKSNYERKKRRGVKGYSTYDITIDGVVHVIGMENRGKYEVPYFISIKKER